MNISIREPKHVHRGGLAGFAALTMTLALASGCHATPPMSPQAGLGAGGPDLSVGAARYPDDDAVILRWEQHWSVDPDGTVHRRDRRWVKILNSRAIGRYADPRIDFNNATDKVIIHTARTFLSDGTVLPVPDYSFNIAAPGDVAGWPEYADWQQRIVSFSGIEDDCVLELDYEIVTKPNVLPWISGDLRLHLNDSTVERIVSVTVPSSQEIMFRVDNIPGSAEPQERADGDRKVLTWSFGNLAGAPEEPQSPPWQEHCGRLRFTTCPGAERWCEAQLGRVDQSALPDEGIRKFSEDAVGEEQDVNDRISKLVNKLRATFNPVSSSKTMRSLECRPAAEVFSANYGNPLEAGALVIAACRALGLEARPMVAVDSRFHDRGVPTDSDFTAIVAAIETDDGPLYVHPRIGVFANPGSWGRHTLLSLDDAGDLREIRIAARGESVVSSIDIAGRVEFKAEGTAEGELRLALTGGYYDPTALDTTAAQQSLVRGFVGRLLSDFNIADLSVTALSDEAFRATVQVRTAEPLPLVNNNRLLTLGDGPVSLGAFPLPLARSVRRSEVRLAGAFAEKIDLTIVLPEGARAKVLPAAMSGGSGSWGGVAQAVTHDGATVRILRDVRINDDRIGPADFGAIREGVNALRAEAGRRLLYGP
ncbi:MAG: DUF3857 domain-containing protein [Phycisphaerales bacterium]|nr:MAG: DUF3857 domain-containing protein [Phycisphaerales bacterium]